MLCRRITKWEQSVIFDLYFHDYFHCKTSLCRIHKSGELRFSFCFVLGTNFDV